MEDETQKRCSQHLHKLRCAKNLFSSSSAEESQKISNREASKACSLLFFSYASHPWSECDQKDAPKRRCSILTILAMHTGSTTRSKISSTEKQNWFRKWCSLCQAIRCESRSKMMSKREQAAICTSNSLPKLCIAKSGKDNEKSSSKLAFICLCTINHHTENTERDGNGSLVSKKKTPIRRTDNKYIYMPSAHFLSLLLFTTL